MRVRFFDRPIVAGGFACAAVLIAGMVLALNGGPGDEEVSTSSVPTTCDLYPLAIPASALAGRAIGDQITDLPHGAGSDQFTWLTWTSDPHEYTLARSLIPPGDSYLYTEPGEPSDHVVDAGDWVERVPDALDTAAVRSKLGEHVGELMLVPVRGASRERDTFIDDQVGQFAVIRLTAYDLSAPARISFEFLGYRDCRNTAPTASPQSVSTPEDTALLITLSGSDAENDTLSFEIATPPQHGTLSGQAPDLVYTPSQHYHGPDSFTFRARDASLVSEDTTIGITVSPVNDAPVITSTADIVATEGAAYAYQATASDPDADDTLAFSLAAAPAGMTVDVTTGLVAWTPTTAQSGDHPVTLVVTDAAGATGQQSFTVTVSASNRAPRIVSIPVLDFIERVGYSHQVVAEDPDAGDVVQFSLVNHPAGMSIAANTGLITWSGEGFSGNNRLPNAMCRVGAGVQGGLPSAADIIAVVDESGSMSDKQAWLTDIAPALQAHLLSNGVGDGLTPNRYGLVGYDALPREFPIGGSQMGDFADFIAQTKRLVAGIYATEDGWRAIHHAVTMYPLRDGVARNLILVTDEDRDDSNYPVTYPTLLQELLSRKIMLNAVIPVRFSCGDGTRALGLGQGSIGFKEDGRGGYITCTGAVATQGGGTAIADYLDLALATGGAGWDVEMISRGGLTTQSFSNALVRVKVQEIRGQLQDAPLADLYVDAIRASGGWVNVDIGNRGRIPLEEGARVDIHADERLISSMPLPALAIGEKTTVATLWPTVTDLLAGDPSRISATIVPAAGATLCASDNDRLDVAWVRVRATDRGGLFDEQAFAVQAVDANDAPTVAAIADGAVSVGRWYRHIVQASDPDRGDALRFALAGAPLGMQIDERTGAIAWMPDVSQIGTHQLEVSATDLAGEAARATLRIVVNEALPPPRFTTTPDRRAIQGTHYTYQAGALGEPAAVLRFAVVIGPAGMHIDPVSGFVEWDVPPDHAGKVDHVVLRVRDQYGNYDLQMFTLLGDLPNQPPSVSSVPTLQAMVGNNYGFLARAQDVNVLESFRWRIDHGPVGAGIDAVSGSLLWPSTMVSSRHPAGLLAINPYCVVPADGATPLSHQKMWTTSGFSYLTQTLVGPLIDNDLDGELSDNDLTAVVSISWTGSPRVHAFDMRDGRVLWSHAQRVPDGSIKPAMADLEGTGDVSVLFVDNLRHLVALRPDGTLRWVSAAPVAPTSLAQSAVTVSDLDADGRAEVLVGPSVYSARGELKWQFSASTSSHPGIPAAIDLDGDGRREVLYRGEIRDASGALRVRTQSMRDTTVQHAFYAPIRIQGSPERFVAISETTFAGHRLSVIDTKGNARWVRSGLAASGPVVVADFDGDGSEDLYVAALNSLYSQAGEPIWTTNSGNGNAIGSRAATVGDIDRDGELEILTFNRATSTLNIIAGRTGAVIGSIRDLNVASDSVPPTIVDPQGSGNATLVVGHISGLSAYRSAGMPWHSLARVVHQAPFALDQIRGDMRLNPVDLARAPAATHVVGVRQPVSVPTRFLSDLRVSAPYGREVDAGFEINVDLLNRGTRASGPSEVVLYRGDAGGAELGRMSAPALQPGQSHALKLLSNRAALGNEEVTAVVVASPDVQECELANNLASGRVMQISVSDYGSLEGTQSWLVAVTARIAAPTFTTVAPTQATEGQPYRYQAAATSPNVGDVVTYTLSNAPEGARVDARTGEVTWTPRWGLAGNFTFVLEAQSLGQVSMQQVWTVRVAASTEPNRLPDIVSQPLMAATVNEVYRYDVRASDPDGHGITYSLGTAPAGMRIDAATGRLLWQPASVPSAPVPVVVVATDERQGRAEQAFAIQVYATPNRAPVITSRPDLALMPGTPWQYTVNASDADGDALTVVWNILPSGMTTNGSSASWSPNTAQAGEHAVEVEVRDTRGGVVKQAFTLFVNDPASNASPRVTSTPNPRASVGSAYAYTVAAVDDDGDTLRFALQQRARGMSIDASTGAISWTPAGDQLGDHFVVLQVSDGRGGVVWQTWTVRVEEYGSGINRAPRISTVAPLTGKVGRAYRYDLAANDPDGDLLAYSLAESPVGMTIDAQTGRIDWTPDAIGSHAVRVRVSDGLLWTEQSWTLQVKDAPLSAIIDPATAQLSPNAPHAIRIVPSDAASQVHVALTLDGVLVPVEDDLTAIVSSATPGRHVLVALVNDGYDTVSVEAEFHVLVEGGADAPVIAITSPAEGGVVTAPTTVTGSVSDADLVGWTLTAVDRNGGFGRELARGTAAVSGTLGSFDPTLLLNGQYALVLHAWDAAGNQTKAISTVVVEGDMKLGHFSVTFEDVSVPVMGIPITITRTYDTRRSGQSLDFGHGWTVDYQNVRLHESRQLGLGWRVEQSGSGLFSNWCVRPQGDPVVTVALPDGSVEKFRAKAMPECQFLVPPTEVELVFEPMAGTYSQLSQTRYGGLRVVANELVDLNDEGNAVDPDQYRLTLKDGTVYDLDQAFGLRKVSDAHGNSLSFSREGVSHSTGVGVRFIRDAAGRIVRMELPDETAIRYEYDANGDLVRMTDQVSQSVRYGYMPVSSAHGTNAHYLQDIIDPRNIRVSRNEYDPDGRLVAQVDADGKRVEYALDIGARTQSVKNRLDEVTTYVFDDRGRVLLERNALNETIRRTYDVLGNTLSEENGEGETTRWTYDAAGNKETETNHLGQVTRWSYDRRGQVISQTNANGDVTSLNRYDSRSGDLTSTEDGTGARTDLVYGTGGTLLELRQPEQALTTYGYNSRGDKTYERGPDGVEISHLYDAAGRARSESRTFTDETGQRRTLTTQFRYDDKGRLIETIDHANRTTRTEYNAIDKVSAQVDALGRRTEMVYDARGNHTETHFPGGTSEITVYDEENRVVGKIDRGQRTTTYVHDDAGRVVETHHPDNSVEYTRYDKSGREVARVDGRTNTTTFVYDDAGRLLSTTNALNQTTSTTYRPDGSKASVRDALGRVTKFEYDGAGRLVTTLHPDNTPSNDADNPRSRVSYDALGRKRSQTDEMQRTTTFEYNAAGQMTAVVDALQQRTVYGYDSRGRKVSQTDALNRTTRWEYDDDGRVLARVLPLGQRETMEYDAIGRLSAKTDFNGARTTYRYDAADRVEEVRHADGTGVVTDYTDSGQVETQMDAAGTTHHLYDARDRLLRITHPDGIQIAYQGHNPHKGRAPARRM